MNRPYMIRVAQHIWERMGKALWGAGLRTAGRCLPLGPCQGTVAINMFPAPGSWGGSSVFVRQFAALMRERRFRVVFDLTGSVDIILLIDPRDDLQYKAFGLDAIHRYRKQHPTTKLIHRINECDQRKATVFMDPRLCEANQDADYTVFISEWLRDYFRARWFPGERPHRVIYNGADPRVFHPGRPGTGRVRTPFRLVTHHWSPNPMKGFPVYKQLDDLIAEGRLPGVELWVIGQWPENLTWRCTRTFPPASGHRLADLLRSCDAYITASLWEPCGMHHVEGAQCGLPLLYHEDGGGIVEAGRKYGIAFREATLVNAVRDMQARYEELRIRLLANMPDGRRMARDYGDLVQEMMAGTAVTLPDGMSR